MPTVKELSKEVNKDYRVLVEYPKQRPKIIGAGQVEAITGTKQAFKAFSKTLELGADKYIYKIRTGVRIHFYSK